MLFHKSVVKLDKARIYLHEILLYRENMIRAFEVTLCMAFIKIWPVWSFQFK